jgi:very-short-patch-repair endonuclease
MGLLTGDSEDVRRNCESAIEQMLCVALFLYLGLKAIPGSFSTDRLTEMAKDLTEPAAFLFSQHWIERRYRTDFLIVAVNPHTRRAKRLVLECDGREHHDGNEERDAERAAWIRGQGYALIRFSGKEIMGYMPDVIARVERWLREAGVEPQEQGMAWILRTFTPDGNARRRRNEERRILNEQLDAEEREETPMISDEGGAFRWSDTI